MLPRIRVVYMQATPAYPCLADEATKLVTSSVVYITYTRLQILLPRQQNSISVLRTDIYVRTIIQATPV